MLQLRCVVALSSISAALPVDNMAAAGAARPEEGADEGGRTRRAALLLTSTFDDSYAALPLRLASYGHAVAEALHQTPLAAYGKPFTLLTLAYIGVASFSRSVRAGELERHPELMRKARVSAAMDSAGTTWLECITLPSLILGSVHRVLSSATPTVRGGVCLALLPAVLPASSLAADALMDWAFRPAIAYMAQPSGVVLRPGSPEYVPPPPDALLAGVPDSVLLGGPDMGVDDPLARAQLEWALDGNPTSAFPEEVDAKGGRAAGGAAGGAAAARGGQLTGGVEEAEALYLAAVADIKRRAEARRAGAEAGRGTNGQQLR